MCISSSCLVHIETNFVQTPFNRQLSVILTLKVSYPNSLDRKSGFTVPIVLERKPFALELFFYLANA